MKSKIIVLTLLTALLVSVVAPSFTGRVHAATPVAGVTHANPAFLDRTRFLLHAGIAFFAIHHEYKRYKEGYFSAGAPHRVSNIVKAAAVLLIGYHEAKVAYGIAEKSNSKTLHALASPINLLVSELSSVRARFSKGQFSATDMQMLNNSTNTINGESRGNGTGTINDVSTPLPSGT